MLLPRPGVRVPRRTVESEFQPAHLLEPTDDLTAAERKELIASMRPSDAEGVPELHEVDIPDDLREQIEKMMSRYPQLRSASIPALWAVQQRYGWCTPDGIRQAAAVMGVTPAYLQSVASFYDLFATEPVGRHRVLVCTNISCWMRGGDELLGGVLRGHRGRPPRGRPPRRLAPRTASSSSRASSASAPATWRRWRRSTIATTVRSTTVTPSRAIEALRSGAEPLPDKELAKRPAAGGPEPAADPRLEGTDVA